MTIEIYPNYIDVGGGTFKSVGNIPVQVNRWLGRQYPWKYTVFEENNTYYMKNEETGKIEDSNSEPGTVINSALSSMTSGRTWIEKIALKGTFPVNVSLTIPSYTFVKVEGEIKANIDLSNLLHCNNQSFVYIYGGKIDGNGKATTVINFYQSTPTVTHNRVGYCIVCGAKDTVGSCLINITGNSGIQIDQPWLDGRVNATGTIDSTRYGIRQLSSGGQNTVYLGDTNNFFKTACIHIKGGYLTLIGGALEGGHGTARNIIIKSDNSGVGLRVFGTWMESNTDNILIQEGSYSPAFLDLAPCYMSAGGSGYANVRSSTTSNHLEHLRVRGGTWVNPGGTYCIDCEATEAIIDKVAFGQDINVSKLSHYVVFNYPGWVMIKTNDPVEIGSTLTTAGAHFTSDVLFDNNLVMRWKNTSGVQKNVLKLGNDDKTELQMYDGLMYDPSNFTDNTLSGTPKIVEIKIDGVSYYFKVYPTLG